MSEVEDLLRLAWLANADGRSGMRDALLTLLVAESGADDAVLAARCRRLLIAHRPDHYFASTTTLGQALGHPKVVAALGTLRRMYPPVRVQHLLLRGESARGPYQPYPLPLARILEDLSPDRGAVLVGRARRRPSEAARSLPFPSVDSSRLGLAASGSKSVRQGGPDPDGTIAVFYVSVLLALAILLENVLKPSSQDTKAA